MFARYEYKAGSLAVEIVADIVKLLTGTTDTALLSASCIKENTTITNDGSRPAGWEVWDAAAATRAQCIRALNEDGQSYKYVLCEHNNANFLFLKAYENWNAATHVGTNSCYSSDSWGIAAQLSAGGTIFISASERGIIAQGYATGSWDTGPVGIMEHTRDEPWDTPAFGVPPFVYFGQGTTQNIATMDALYSAYKPRAKDIVTGNDVLTSNAVCWLIGPYGERNVVTTLFNTGPRKRVRDASFNLVHAFARIMATSQGTLHGKLHDIFLTTGQYGNLADEAVYQGKTYFMMGTGPGTYNGARIAVPKF